MTEAFLPCPACETNIRFRDGLPDRPSIECPRCGEVIPLRQRSQPRRPQPRDDYDRRRPEPEPRYRERPRSSGTHRVAASNPRIETSEGGTAGIWVGVIGGSVGILGLILGVIFFANSGKDSSSSSAPTTSSSEGENASNPAPSNPAEQFVANVLPTPVVNNQPQGQISPERPGLGGPTLPAGPDGVIPAPAGGNANVAAMTNHLKYNWNANPEFGFRTTIRAEVGDEVHEIRGVATYQVVGHDPTFNKIVEDENKDDGMATGTGFVVSPDGYLMTCAHVIEGGKKIVVELNGQTYAARIVDVNAQRDLALIQIAARNLPVLPIADSSRLELAQHVRLVGYPLSSVLGTSVKVTQGSVAGFIDRKGGRMIQVDASMNPGNSGGPLVNDRGEAIGVASAGYFGSDIAEVGLAIPTNDVSALMRKNGVTPKPAGTNPIMDGPALAKKVTPSVAYLKVTMGASSQDSLVLKHFSTFTTTKQRRDGRPLVSGISTPSSDSGRLLVDNSGQILRVEGGKQNLPFGLGPLSVLAFEPITPDGDDSWSTQRLTTITQVQQQESRFDPFSRYGGIPRPPFMRPRGFPSLPSSPFSPGGSTEVTKVHMALEVCEYELGEESPGFQTISKNYDFQTIENKDEPYFKLFGTGTIRFNRTRGITDRLHQELQLHIRPDKDTLVRVPIDVFSELLTNNELADQKPQVSNTTKPAVPPAVNNPNPNPNPPPVRPATPQAPTETLDDLLAKLQDPQSNFSHKFTALHAISRMPPEEKRRKEVLDVVEPMLKESNSSLQNTAISLFGKWGTEDRAGVLIEMAGGFSMSHRWAAMKALGEIGGKKSAEAIAKRMTDSTDMLTATHALMQMGSVAEDPVLPLIDHAEQQVRYNAYRVLGKVGGSKSEAALKDKAESDPNNFNRAAAGIALRELQKR